MAKEYTRDELAEWFRDKASATKGAGAARNKLFDAEERHTDQTREFVGNMYFFRYDPKHRLTLPMYDKYPLVFVVDRYTDGFLGLNLHYLTKGQRGRVTVLFNEFYNSRSLFNGIVSGSQSNWDLIQTATSGLESFSKQCVKRYLYTHIRSQLIRIDKTEYDKAVQLPIDEWVYRK